jgi:hypothetical protein
MTLIRPIGIYGCEIWILSARDVNNFLVFERKILRRIYGPVQTEERGRIRNMMNWRRN